MNALIDDRAIDDEEDDVSFDEETGEPRHDRTNGENGITDSSEEEDDDDEEEAQRIRKDFIVDEEEDDDDEARRRRRREKRKRPREDREDEGLDEEDLELIGLKPQRDETQSKFKRLKRGPREEDETRRAGIDDIFADDLEDQEERRPRGLQDDDDDGWIVQDEFSDDEQQQVRDDLEVARPSKRNAMVRELNLDDDLDEATREDIRAAFGDGTDYDFALDKEYEAEEEEAEKDRRLDLKDVFEPSQLKEKLLTEEDNVIRFTDEPERHQLAREAYKDLELSEDEFQEEATWISKLLWPSQQTRLPQRFDQAFRRTILQVLEFMVREDLEVPFIHNNRKDYLIYVDQDDPDGRKEDAIQLLRLNELWAVFELDLRFRALIERRHALQKVYEELKSNNTAPDTMLEEMLIQAETMEELQDVQDYLYFQYASEIKDLALTNTSQTNGVVMSQKKANTKSIYETIRASKAYTVTRAFGITASAFAQNLSKSGLTTYAEDHAESPVNLADSMIDEEFSNGEKVLKAGRAMFAEEIVTNPRFRKYMRGQIYARGLFDCYRTEKGVRKIDEQHPYYEFKYLRNQTFLNFVDNPSMFLRMLKAEEEGLIEVKVKFHNPDSLKREITQNMKTDNYSDVADAWNKEREAVVSMAFDKVMTILGRLVKENLRSECEGRIADACREEFDYRLDQAPYQPKGMRKGTTPRVLTLSIGRGIPGKDPIYWTFVSDDGRPTENGTFVDLVLGNKEHSLPDGKDVKDFVDLIDRKNPEVIGISGFTPDTRTVIKNLIEIIGHYDLRGPTFADENDRDQRELLRVITVNDEVARLYHTSEKARTDHPGWAILTHYCFALARYLQDPIKEYASLGSDIISLTFHRAQHLLPKEKLMKKLEMALVDKVNMVGVDVNESSADPAIANLLPYVCGLGPRKAQHLIKVLNMNGGYVQTRANLVIADEGAHAAMGTKVWNNAASTLYISYEQSEEQAEFLDSTRIHPEDYDLARKIAADALELDEEDIAAERAEYGDGAILRRLIREEAQDRVEDLVLEEYAEQLEKNLSTKKRSTLEAIRAELQEPYEELRREFKEDLEPEEVFTMFTGETVDTLQVGMNVPISLKRISDDFVEGILDCGMVAVVEPGAWHDDPSISPRSLYGMHQTVQAHITDLNRERFTCNVSLREEQVKRPFKRFDPDKLYKYDEWDSRQEAADKRAIEQKSETGGRATRVIKHPLFRPFNSKQAEEYLGSQNRGDVVIRPSSKGSDHLAITWKVGDGIFQHIDVLELDKENEFALGKTLRIGGRYNYSDLDELIVSHIRGMSRKVDEMMNSDKFQEKSKAQLEEWLNTYTAANPKRSMYQFGFNRERPGYFHLVFKAGQKAKLMEWSVKVIPNGFELRGQQYPDMRGLCNGFKLLFKNMEGTQAALGGMR